MENCEHKWDEETVRVALCRKCNITDLELDAITKIEGCVKDLEEQVNKAKKLINELKNGV